MNQRSETHLAVIDKHLHEVEEVLVHFRTAAIPELVHFRDHVDALISLSHRLRCLSERAEDLSAEFVMMAGPEAA